jgi:hypothetical protein
LHDATQEPLQSALRVNRKWIYIAVLLVGACAQKSSAPMFPATIGGAWRLKSAQTFPAGAAPEMVRKIGTRGGWIAAYEGPGTATAELYELTSSPGGLEMAQRWQAVADTVVWYTPRYFVVVKWQSSDRLSVSTLIRALEKQFVEGK